MKRLLKIFVKSKESGSVLKDSFLVFKNEIKNFINSPKKTSLHWLQSFHKKLFQNLFMSNYRYHLFMYLSQGLRNGGTTKKLLESMLIEYKDLSKNKFGSIPLTIKQYCNYEMYRIVNNSISYISIDGDTDAEAMYKAGLINSKEYTAVSNISSAEPYRAIEFVNERAKDQDNLKFAVLMLFFPSLLVLGGYFVFQPELKAMTISMLEPVNAVSVAKIDIPGYIKDRTVFGLSLIGMITFIVTIFSFVSYLKKNNPKMLFKLLKMTEREFIINSFELMLGLMRAGQSPIQAISAIKNGADDEATKRIFSEIEKGFLEGEKKMYEVFKEYGMDISTIAYIRGGESQNYLEPAILMALEYNRALYNKSTARMTKYLPLAGEIIMSIILLKPLLDILMVTTSGTLNFKV